MANTKNLASGTLAEDISNSDTLVLVYVGSGSAATIKAVWPTAPFYITVMPHIPVAGVSNSMDSEVMKVTAVGNDQVGNVALTVERAQRGTTAKSFTAGAIVTNGIYAEDVAPPYSTTETATLEKWIDGNTIYKKTVYFSSLPNNTTKTVSLGVNNVSYVIKIEGSAYRDSDGAFFTIPNASAIAVDNSIDVAYLKNSKEVQIRTGMDRTDFIAYVTVYYTKTS